MTPGISSFRQHITRQQQAHHGSTAALWLSVLQYLAMLAILFSVSLPPPLPPDSCSCPRLSCPLLLLLLLCSCRVTCSTCCPTLNGCCATRRAASPPPLWGPWA
jgi:hypothetical protein